MKCLATAGILLLALSGNGLAQQLSEAHQHTTPPPGARFEVIQSELAAKWTFRLDRFTGHVAQLVKTKDDDNAWEEMPVIDLPSVTAPSRPGSNCSCPVLRPGTHFSSTRTPAKPGW